MQQIEVKQNAWHMVTWVDKPVKKGNLVTLQGQEGWWEVLKVSSNVDKERINQGWAVGGVTEVRH